MRPTCQPKPSLRRRRNVFVVGCLSAAIALVALVLSRGDRNRWLAPGDLTAAHARLLASSETSSRCSTCHENADAPLSDWLRLVSGSSTPQDQTQTDLCLHCHQESFHRQTAVFAHGLEPGFLAKQSDQRSQGEFKHEAQHTALACAICHREHHGAKFNLSQMSNEQCATCHIEPFSSFRRHSEFSNWPFERRTRIKFDHRSHAYRHFPSQGDGKSFDCRSCHLSNDGRDIVSTQGFKSCQSCHERDIIDPLDEGLRVLALPLIDQEVFREAGIEIEQWPAEATGSFDGEIPLLMHLLLMQDAQAADALRHFPVPFDFLDVDPNDPRQVRWAADIVAGIQRLLLTSALPKGSADDVSSDGVGPRSAINDIDAVAAAVRSHLSPFVIEAAAAEWFQPSAHSNEKDQPANLRGWTRDDETFEIIYRPVRHADEFLTMLFHAVLAAGSGETQVVGELEKELLSLARAGNCIRCHSVDQTGQGKKIHWQAKQRSPRRQFTRFSHRPHLIQPELHDCSACHRFNADADVMSNYKTFDATGHAGDFHNLHKAECASCHRPDGAGDQCLQCHRYHIDPDGDRSSLPPLDITLKKLQDFQVTSERPNMPQKPAASGMSTRRPAEAELR